LWCVLRLLKAAPLDLGSGYLNPGDALLAAGVEASLRAAREALLRSAWRTTVTEHLTLRA
jgi:hypothetical protein